MTKTLFFVTVLAATLGWARQVTTTTVVKNVTTTVVESVAVSQEARGVRKIAVFVQNRTRVVGMDDEVDGVRDRLSAALAEVAGVSVVDSSQVADAFRRHKVTAEEEKSALVSGIFTGGSIPRIAEMLGCDYIAVASIVNAAAQRRKMSGRSATVFTLRMTLKVMDATGASIDGLPVWVRQLPVLEASDDPMTYYQMLFDQWAEEATAALASQSHRWRAAATPARTPVTFTVSSTIDKIIADLESRTKGASGEQLQELRRVVGGVTVELDGTVIGSTPGTFRAAGGLHQLRVTRAWMKPFTATVTLSEGAAFSVALELSDEGIRQWGSLEALRADIALRYAAAVKERGIRITVDTSGWRDVGQSGIRVIQDK
jgi:hypothetical protein